MSCLGHTLNTLTRNHKKSHDVLSKHDFVLGHIHSHPELHVGRGLATLFPPLRNNTNYVLQSTDVSGTVLSVSYALSHLILRTAL